MNEAHQHKRFAFLVDRRPAQMDPEGGLQFECHWLRAFMTKMELLRNLIMELLRNTAWPDSKLTRTKWLSTKSALPHNRKQQFARTHSKDISFTMYDCYDMQAERGKDSRHGSEHTASLAKARTPPLYTWSHRFMRKSCLMIVSVLPLAWPPCRTSHTSCATKRCTLNYHGTTATCRSWCEPSCPAYRLEALVSSPPLCILSLCTLLCSPLCVLLSRDTA